MELTLSNKIYLGEIESVTVLYDSTSLMITLVSNKETLMEISYTDAMDISHSYVRFAVEKIKQIGDNNGKTNFSNTPV